MKNIAMGSAYWKKTEDLFVRAFDVPVEERDRFLRAACGDDLQLRTEVTSLLACDFDEHQLDVAIQTLAAGLAQEESWVGRRLGAYRLTAELGRGGMGVVYLAERDDQRFEKKVAIKLVARGTDSPLTRARLEAERRILAHLEHPSIAKLLDAGETDTGVPYFVMEYAEGPSLDQYAADITPAAACRLMARIAEAVAYAHRSLVVHRDLKPSNILITADGEPKLLDFGIAGLLEENDVSQPLRAFTPEYAAPELLSGHPVTTAADVYSLGVLLRRLLPAPPADVDAIIRHAVALDPGERYPTAAEFAADLHRYLGGFPVLARDGRASYRTFKFIGRHRLAVAAAILALVGLAGTTASALWQARRAAQALTVAEASRRSAVDHARAAQTARDLAEQQRAAAGHERDRARTEAQLAQQRLEQLVALASRTVNGIHNTLETIPGATVGRRQIVEQTLEFLNRTREQAGQDPALLHTVAVGYWRMGMVLGVPKRPNLGEPARAIHHLRQADTLFTTLLRRSPADTELQAEWIEVRRMLALSVIGAGRAVEGMRLFRQTIQQAEPWAASERVVVPLAELYEDLMGAVDDLKEARRLADRAVALLTPMAARHTDDVPLQNALASAYSRQMESLKMEGDSAQALRVGLRIAAIRESLQLRRPDDVLLLRNLMLIYSRLSSLSGESGMGVHLGDRQMALVYARKMIALAEQLAQRDPANRNARFDSAMAHLRAGMIEPDDASREESQRWLQQSAARLEELVKESSSLPYRLNLAASYEFLGRRANERQDGPAASAWAEKSLQTALPLTTPSPAPRTVYVQVLYSYQLLLRLGQPVEKEALAALAVFRQYHPTLDAFDARFWQARGEHLADQGDRESACVAYRAAVAAWQGVPQQEVGVTPAERKRALTLLNGCPN